MKKMMGILIIMIIVCVLPVKADVNIVADIDSEGGSIDFWANPNSGTGSTTYYLDGVDYKETQRIAANSRGSIVSRVYKAFMQWKLQSNGKFAWQVTDFDSLEPAYQKLRYVLENWFVPRKEMAQVIKQQQDKIKQLNMEIEAIGKVLGEEKICEARQLVMQEQGLPSVTCGNRTVYNTGVALEVIEW